MKPRAISIAILAMGGEGGGVLADWLIDLAERNGFAVQATSVPGVAQRTGATIYYLEMFPLGDVPAGGAPRVVSEFGLWGLPALGTDAPDDGALDERW